MTALEAAAGTAARIHQQLIEECRSTPPVDLALRARELVRSIEPLLAGPAVDALVAEVMATTAGLGVLQPLMLDPEVCEVMVNGGGDIWVERSGVLERVPVRLDRAALEQAIAAIIAPLGRRVDRASPMVDARLHDGSRINAVIPPISIDGPCLTIRRFRAMRIALEEIAEPIQVKLLRDSVEQRRNILVSGATGSGKTTLLNVLAGIIPANERVITIEDTAELSFAGAHVVRLEARDSNAEGAGVVTIRDLVRNSLRMRPDRIIVGEVRGPEALDMVQAMNTGHNGSMSTLHANSPADALHRLETMILMAAEDLPLAVIREHIASAIDIVVQVVRGQSGSRRVSAVTRVAGVERSSGRLAVDVLA